MVNRIGYSLRSMLRYTILGTLDNLAGAAVGIFTWVFGMSVFFWLLSTIGVEMPLKYRNESFLYEYTVPIAPQIISVISDWIPVGGNLIREWGRGE